MSCVHVSTSFSDDERSDQDQDYCDEEWNRNFNRGGDADFKCRHLRGTCNNWKR